MIDAVIRDGDVVVVRRQDGADEGDVVAALVPGPAEDEATVKRFHRADDGRIQLIPANQKACTFSSGPILLCGPALAYGSR